MPNPFEKQFLRVSPLFHQFGHCSRRLTVRKSLILLEGAQGGGHNVRVNSGRGVSVVLAVAPPSRRLSRGRLAHAEEAEGETPSGQPARCRRYVVPPETASAVIK